MGQRLRLKAGYAIPANWTKQERALLLGLKKYGAMVSDKHVTGAKIVLGDFNEWMKGLTTTLLSSKLKSVDLTVSLESLSFYLAQGIDDEG